MEANDPVVCVSLGENYTDLNTVNSNHQMFAYLQNYHMVRDTDVGPIRSEGYEFGRRSFFCTPLVRDGDRILSLRRRRVFLTSPVSVGRLSWAMKLLLLMTLTCL